MTLLAKVLPPTLTAVVRGQHVRAATAVFDRLLMGQHWATRPAERDAKCVLSRIIVCGLHLIEPGVFYILLGFRLSDLMRAAAWN